MGSIMSQVSDTVTAMRSAFVGGTIDYIAPEDASSTVLLEEEEPTDTQTIVEAGILNILG